ncbi:MAG: hypothetical protein K0U54_02905 [Bacteroidetes bacterium]|nr:hypothetical protein [Bacteroidota bacterium]
MAGEAEGLEDYLYTAEWNFEDPYGTTAIEGFEIPVNLPKKPPRKYFKNYGKKVKNQKFKRESIPNNLKDWSDDKRDAYVDKLYHKRNNGEWWLIKGKEIYITGRFWFYLNFWQTEAGVLPQFREGDYCFFLVWEHCFLDKECYGLLDIKGRRMGDTEKALFLMWEFASITRNSWCGMQNVKEDDAQDNFLRIVVAHNKIPWYFKPIMKGRSAPTKVMLFDYPEVIYSHKKLEDKKNKGELEGQSDIHYKYDAIRGRIDFESSGKGKYDGKRLGIWHLDEPGKIEAFDVNEQWAVIKPALALSNGKIIVGKTIWTTTVEDIETSKTLENIKKTWDGSDPNKRNDNNRTTTGMYRYFRNCVYAHEVDEWGFHKKEECLTMVFNTIKGFEELTDWDGLASFQRKHPITIEDVFRPPHNECILYPALLDRRKIQLETDKNGIGGDFEADGSRVKNRIITGDFVWTNGFGSQVQWLPGPKGKWHVSRFPKNPNNCFVLGDGLPRPGNDPLYTMGVDPVDHMTEDGQGSDGAAVIYERFNSFIDTNVAINDKDEVEEFDRWKLITSNFVADFVDRPDDPTELFEEILMAAIYYGVAIFPETNRGSIVVWFNENGFKHYVKHRPEPTRVDTAGKKGKKKKERGTKASKPIINLYIQELKKYVVHRIVSTRHVRIINDFRLFNGKNRTVRDLTVAAGFALLSDMDQKYLKKKEKKNTWSKGMPVKKRKHRL